MSEQFISKLSKKYVIEVNIAIAAGLAYEILDPGCHQGHVFSKHLKPVQRLPPDDLAVIVMLVKLFETISTCGSCQPPLSSHICPWRLVLILALTIPLQHSALDINIIQAVGTWRRTVTSVYCVAATKLVFFACGTKKVAHEGFNHPIYVNDPFVSTGSDDRPLETA